MDEIKNILQDTTLTLTEKNKKIQEFMIDFNKNNINKVKKKECEHYKRNCNIIANCCNNIYGCRLCHDSYEDHPINRFETKEIICKKCNTIQGISNECICCKIQFGEYFCNKCNLWRENNKEIYHCDKCGVCNIGFKDKFIHCDFCQSCYANTHVCNNKITTAKCSVCNEQILHSVIQSTLPKCGHYIHITCMTDLLKNDYKCPLCKKTIIDIDWTKYDNLILLQEMPNEYKKKVNIKCNDCLNESINIDFHFLGCKCNNCGGYNTFINT